MTPPRFAERTLRAVLAEDVELREALLGDMSEGWSMQASASSARAADRWYWKQTLLSLPSLLALWCQTIGAYRLSAIATVAILARMLMLVLQYAVMIIGTAALSGLPRPAVLLASVLGCLGPATLAGFIVRRIAARDATARIGALCIAALMVHAVSPRLMASVMPAWLFWITTAPLSVLAIILGATLGQQRVTRAIA